MTLSQTILPTSGVLNLLLLGYGIGNIVFFLVTDDFCHGFISIMTDMKQKKEGVSQGKKKKHKKDTQHIDHLLDNEMHSYTSDDAGSPTSAARNLTDPSSVSGTGLHLLFNHCFVKGKA